MPTFEQSEFNILGGDFGIMSNFGLVGFDSIDLKAHTNSNLATPQLIVNTGVDFGTNIKNSVKSPEASYVQAIKGDGLNNVMLGNGSIFVVGKDVSVKVDQDTNAWNLNGKKVTLHTDNNPSVQDALWRDGSKTFLDFSALKSEAIALNQKYAGLNGNEGADVNFKDTNNRTIALHPGVTRAHVNVSFDNLKGNKIYIRGSEKSHPQVLVVNVDMAGVKEAEFPATEVDGVAGGEVSTWSKINVVLNLYDSKAQDRLWTGKVNGQGDFVKGSFLAPSATVVANKNVNGQIIANKIEISAEFHRDSFDTSAFFNVTKVLSGRDLREGEFSFKLQAQNNDTPMPGGSSDGSKTVSNDTFGNVPFGDVQYKYAGTYRYRITEVVPDDATAHKDGAPVSPALTYEDANENQKTEYDWVRNGVTYDSKTWYEVTVKVTDLKGSPQISYTKYGAAADEGVAAGHAEFKNTFTTSAEAELKGSKIMVGRSFQTGDRFKFNISRLTDKGYSEGPLPSGVDEDGNISVDFGDKEGASGEFSFGTFRFAEPGIYAYQVTEVHPKDKNEVVPGVSYSDAVYRLVFTVTEKDDGSLGVEKSLTKTKDDGGKEITSPASVDDKAAFQNTYQADSARVTPKARKEYSDPTGSKPLADNMFEFMLTPWTGTETGSELKGDDLFGEGRANTGENVLMPEGNKNADGSLTVKNRGNDVNFGSIAFSAELSADDEELGNEALSEKSVNHWYRITENVPADATNPSVSGGFKKFEKANGTERAIPGWSLGGMKYDGNAYYLRVRVYWQKQDDRKFHLIAAPTYFDAQGSELKKEDKPLGFASFSNSYDSVDTSAELKAEKMFMREDGNAPAELGDRVFAFILKPLDSMVNGKKVNADGVPMPEGKTSAEGNAIEVNSVKDKDHTGKATVDFGTIQYDKPGTYNYEISEKQTAHPGVTFSKAAYRATVTVADVAGALSTSVSYTKIKDETGAATEDKTPLQDGALPTFTNRYHANGSISLQAKKSYSVDEEAQTTGMGAFRFTLKGEDAAPMPTKSDEYDANTNSITVHAEDNGSITFPEISYSLADLPQGHRQKTFAYTVTEVIPDDATATIDGKNVKYVDATPEQKALNTVWTDSDGITYDGTVATYKVTINNDGQGNIETSVSAEKGNQVVENGIPAFANSKTTIGESYPGAKISGKKILKNEDNENVSLESGKYSFILEGLTGPADLTDDEKNAAGIGQEITMENDENGDFSHTFPENTFKKVGTYTYKLFEVGGGKIDADGIHYDDSVYTVTITVTNNEDGQGHALTATVSYSLDDKPQESIDAPEFVNAPGGDSYKGNPRVSIGGVKTLDGGTPADGRFSFTLTGLNGAPMPEGTAAESDTLTVVNAGGAFSFGKIRFSNQDRNKTYHYTISEVGHSGDGITYDTHVYNISVRIVQDDDPNTDRYVAKIVVDGESVEGQLADKISFHNTTTPKPEPSYPDLTISGSKTLTGRDLKQGEFTFELVDTTEGSSTKGQVIDTAENASSGAFDFGKITYTAAGTYTYEVREKLGNAEGVTYDGRVYTVTVKVTADGTHLTASKPVVTLDGKSVSAISFKNVYEEEQPDSTTVILTATKILTGRDLHPGEFTFELFEGTEAQGTPIDTATNASNGSISFKKLTFTKPGVYTYTVREKAGTISGVTYDTTVCHYTVTVTEGVDGKLTAKVTADAPDGKVVFKNTYEEENPPEDKNPPEEENPPADTPGNENPPSDSELPKTGDTGLPVRVLAATGAFGAALVAAGVTLLRKRNR